MRKPIDPSPAVKVVIGAIGVLYGTVRLLTALLGGLGPAPAGVSAYQTGQVFGLVIAAAVLFFAARYALRGLAERKALQSGPAPPAPPAPAAPDEYVPGSTPPPRP